MYGRKKSTKCRINCAEPVNKMKCSWFVIFLGAFGVCITERILFVLPVGSKSHYILNQYLIESLAEKGHEVTVIAPYKFSKTVPRLTEIIVPDSSLKLFGALGAKNSAEGRFQTRNMGPLTFFSMSSFWTTIMDDTLNHPPVKHLLQSNQKFDVIVGEAVMMEALLTGFAHKFKAPMVITCPTMPFIYVNHMVGNPAPPAYIPDVALGYTDEMTFSQRLQNYLFTSFANFMLHNVHIPQQNALIKKYFGEDSPPVMNIIYNNPLILINHHFSLSIPRPYIPNMIEVGGYHVRPAKPLPKDINQFISEAKDGVILFSMGTNLRSEEFPPEKFQGILRAFSRLKQRILWKFETENPPNLPENVRISKWLPQSDILAHPNVKLFITHGGLLSITEAVYRGVPLVVIPIFADQPTNAKFVEKIGVGVKLEYDDINENNFYNSIQTVMNNPQYSENAILRSKMLNDRPLSPVDTAIYWIEYAIRHKGAPHLRSGATKLAWYQLQMLDVRIVILSVILLIFTVLKKISCCLIRRLRGDKNKKVSSIKKKN